MSQVNHVSADDANSVDQSVGFLNHQSQSADRWHSYQMLPDLFVQRQSATRVWQFWSAMIFVMLSTLSGIASAFWAQGHKAQTRNANLVALSAPLSELRRESSRLEHENKVCNDWIQIVQSARPDDSVLQSLLAIAESTVDIQNEITIQAVEIKLPLEHSGGTEVPRWAQPELVIEATARSGRDAKQRVREWVTNLGKSERIVTVSLLRDADDDGQSKIEIVGIPRSTRVLP